MGLWKVCYAGMVVVVVVDAGRFFVQSEYLPRTLYMGKSRWVSSKYNLRGTHSVL
jgi:hypothetical protein